MTARSVAARFSKTITPSCCLETSSSSLALSFTNAQNSLSIWRLRQTHGNRTRVDRTAAMSVHVTNEWVWQIQSFVNHTSTVSLISMGVDSQGIYFSERHAKRYGRAHRYACYYLHTHLILLGKKRRISIRPAAFQLQTTSAKLPITLLPVTLVSSACSVASRLRRTSSA